jgi:uncharacterized protein YjiS (DUF1127 family)
MATDMEATMASINTQSYSHRGSWLSGRLTIFFVALVDRLRLWHMTSRERRHLRSVDEAILRDIGVSKMDADYEAARPFWDTEGMDRR